MTTLHLPPLPPSESPDSNTCARVRLYLAVWNDLTPAQRELVSAHVAICERCTREQRLMNHVTFLITRLEETQPSQRVDVAVMAAIAAHQQRQAERASHGSSIMETQPTRYTPYTRNEQGSRMEGATFRYLSILVAAAVVLLAIFTTTRLAKQSASSVFLIPSTLSWGAYVLYHTQRETDNSGEQYQVLSYHDLASQRVHVETVRDSDLDIVYVGSMNQAMPSLAMDEIHHVAQRNAVAWGIDPNIEPMFDLSELRHELQNKSAVYADEDRFRGQKVYRIRCKNGLMLLLDTQYHPVNVLVGAVGIGTGEPLFDTVQLLSKNIFDNSMWSMQVPNGFTMGTLPAKP